MKLVEQAREMMLKAHEGQKRWDGRPYSVHLEQVVRILTVFLGIDTKNDSINETILCAAYLHDVLEDTNVPEISIKEYFGEDVLGIVKELTMKKVTGSTEEYVEHCHKLSFEAKLIKIADILANITDEGHKSDHFILKRVKALKVLLE